MNMIRHDDKSQSLRMARDILVMEALHRYSCLSEGSKAGFAVCGDDCHQIGMVRRGTRPVRRFFPCGFVMSMCSASINIYRAASCAPTHRPCRSPIHRAIQKIIAQ
jgi:hypothetical protein